MLENVFRQSGVDDEKQIHIKSNNSIRYYIWLKCMQYDAEYDPQFKLAWIGG